jgi:hypothetical protein
MLSFSIPTRSGFYDFTTSSRSLAFAGSRHLTIDPQTCKDLISIFGSIGFSFLTGCADGVDASFRRALSESHYGGRAIIACAFKERVKRCYGLNHIVTSANLHPKVALAKRTVSMIKLSSVLILFPSDPIGKGSSLAFRTAINRDIPVFVVAKDFTQDTVLRIQGEFDIHPSGLFGVVKGFWCVPQACRQRPLINEEKIGA